MSGTCKVTNHHMNFTVYIGSVFSHITYRTTMIAHATAPTATIDITHRTTFYIGIGTGGVVLGSKDVIDRSRRTSCIDILSNRTTEKGNVSRTIHITASDKGLVFNTISTSVCIVAYVCTFMNQDIGVVFVAYSCLLFVSENTIVHLSCPYQWVS